VWCISGCVLQSPSRAALACGSMTLEWHKISSNQVPGGPMVFALIGPDVPSHDVMSLHLPVHLVPS